MDYSHFNKKIFLLTIFCLFLINFVSAAYMECLVKTSDNIVSNSPREEWTDDIFETEMIGNSKQGYVVGCEPAGYPWGSEQLNPTKYAIINISEEDFNASWLEPEYDYENPNPLTPNQWNSYNNCINIYCPDFCEGAGLYWLCIADCEVGCDAQYTPYPTITKRKYRLPLENFMDITNQDGTGIDDLKAIACNDTAPRPAIIKNLTNVNALIVYNDWLTGPYDWVGPGDTNCDFYSRMGQWYVNGTNQLVGYPRYARDRTKILILDIPLTLYSVSTGLYIDTPAGLTIKTDELIWDGTFTLPTLLENASLIPEGADVDTAFEVGFANAKLNFDKAVKLTIQDAAGSLVGYSRGGENFTEITMVCGENTQTWADANLGDEEECKIDSGDHLVIWTKHFTEFVTYTFDPIITSLEGPAEPFPIATEVSLTGTFTDPGADTHTAVFDWDDETTSAGIITGMEVTGTHTYTEAGVYTVTLTVTDDDGGSDSEIFQYVVIYDPDGGFVTGTGWIDSPAGAYKTDPTLTGKANFGFVSKYKKGATTPIGNTKFKFRAGDLRFYSDDYQWLVIAGAKAMYKGTGIINDGGNYGFLLSAIDGDFNGEDVDKFRIKIWDKDNGDEVIYDNKVEGDIGDDADPVTELQGGKIVIHK